MFVEAQQEKKLFIVSCITALLESQWFIFTDVRASITKWVVASEYDVFVR